MFFSNKMFVLIIAALISGLSFNASAAKKTSIYDTYVETDIIEEVTSLRISLDETTLKGFVIVPICNYECVDTRLSITPQTRAYYKARQVPLKRAKSRLGREAEIIYEVKSKKVVRITWW